MVGSPELRARIEKAFVGVPVPTRIEEMRLPGRTDEDSYAMAAAFVGKPWTELPIETLFFHREALGSLSPAAYRAYLPAYLAASFASEDWMDKYGPDLRQYLLFTLKPWKHHKPERGAETTARLAALTDEQREVVADVLRFLVARWESEDAAEILRDW